MNSKLIIPKHLPTLEKMKEQHEQYPWYDALAIFTVNEMSRTTKILVDMAENSLKEFKLSRGRYAALWSIAKTQESGTTPAEISAELEVTRGTMTGLLDGLVKDGLIERRHCEDDRRKILVNITKQGSTLLDELSPIHFTFLAKTVSGLTDKEKETFLKLLKKIETSCLKEKGS